MLTDLQYNYVIDNICILRLLWFIFLGGFGVDDYKQFPHIILNIFYKLFNIISYLIIFIKNSLTFSTLLRI
jgi:hypothetical protein